MKAAAEDANKRLTELGYEVQYRFVDLGDTAESVVSDILTRLLEYILPRVGM